MRRCFVIFILCCAGLWCSAQTHIFEAWTGIETSYELNEKTDIEISAESRFQQRNTLLKQYSIEIGSSYALFKGIFVNASYEFANKNKKNGYFPVHTLCTSLGYKKKFDNGLRLNIQTKINVGKNMYTKKSEDERFELVHKNKIKLSYSINKRIRPSLFAETYHPLETGGYYSVSTLKCGINCALFINKQTYFDFGYIRRNEFEDNEIISIITCTFNKSF